MVWWYEIITIFYYWKLFSIKNSNTWKKKKKGHNDSGFQKKKKKKKKKRHKDSVFKKKKKKKKKKLSQIFNNNVEDGSSFPSCLARVYYYFQVFSFDVPLQLSYIHVYLYVLFVCRRPHMWLFTHPLPFKHRHPSAILNNVFSTPLMDDPILSHKRRKNCKNCEYWVR